MSSTRNPATGPVVKWRLIRLSGPKTSALLVRVPTQASLIIRILDPYPTSGPSSAAQARVMVVGGMLGRTGDYRCSVAWWGTEVAVSDGTAVGPDSTDVLVRGPLGLHRPDRGPWGRAGRRPGRRVLCGRASAAGRPSGSGGQDHRGCADAPDRRRGGGDPARVVHRARRG